MQIVAVCRWGAPLEAELPELAKLLKVVAYDLRLRIAQPVPVVITTVPDAQRAMELAKLLRARGHGVVTCDTNIPEETMERTPRDFNFAPTAFEYVDGANRHYTLPYDEIEMLVRVAEISSSDQTTITVEKKVNLGRVVASGGLMIHKKTEKTQRIASEEREQVMYMFQRGHAAEPYALRETSLRYQALGAALKPSTILNFSTFVEQLRARAPQALYDQRFLTQKRKIGLTSFAGLANDRRVENSNAAENMLAAYLMMLGRELGQN